MGGVGDGMGAAQLEQKRASAAFSLPHLRHATWLAPPPGVRLACMEAITAAIVAASGGAEVPVMAGARIMLERLGPLNAEARDVIPVSRKANPR